MSDEDVYDWARDWDGTVDVVIIARCDSLEHAQFVASELEETIGKNNAEFVSTVIEPS